LPAKTKECLLKSDYLKNLLDERKNAPSIIKLKGRIELVRDGFCSLNNYWNGGYYTQMGNLIGNLLA
jgi:hypothetical protein